MTATRLPTGFLFTECGCCGRKFGGSSPDPFKLCLRCERSGCNLRQPKDIAVKHS